MPLAALGFVTRFATGLFSRGRKQADSDHLGADGTESPENFKVSNKEASSEELGHLNPDASDGHLSQKVLETTDEFSHEREVEDAEKTAGTDIDCSLPVGMNVDSAGDENYYSFKHFDITENPLDHYFLVSSAQVS